MSKLKQNYDLLLLKKQLKITHFIYLNKYIEKNNII